ncbi:hypothetical protein BC833DRAFT_625534 [Globomyces pollinis-pini]|nr:hypothetical protein BC833DRAFT_625534 [Globomyces pollinis-pini]
MVQSSGEKLFELKGLEGIQVESLHHHLAILKKFEAMMDSYNTGNPEETLNAVRRFLINAECRYVLYLKLCNSQNDSMIQTNFNILPPWGN